LQFQCSLPFSCDLLRLRNENKFSLSLLKKFQLLIGTMKQKRKVLWQIRSFNLALYVLKWFKKARIRNEFNGGERRGERHSLDFAPKGDTITQNDLILAGYRLFNFFFFSSKKQT
jgi:hypothetical protein